MMQRQNWLTGAAMLFVLPLFVGCSDSKPEMPASLNFQIEAKQAMAAGDTAKAFESLDASIDSKPTIWAYLERAKLHLKAGEEAAAEADCLKALEVDPKSRDVKWLQAEIKKPPAGRFQGQDKFPPSYMK